MAPLLALLVALLAPGAGLEMTPTADGVRIHNLSPVPVVGLRVGAYTRPFLLPDQQLTLTDATGDAVARFPLVWWGAALGDLDPRWADVHLRTAGHFLDGISPGPAGRPREAANIRALMNVTAETTLSWAAGPPLRQALAARAAWHVPPGPLLDGLLAAVSPQGVADQWPPAYAGLGARVDLLRVGIERHGAAALPALRRAPVWAHDRGFDPIILLDALLPDPPHHAAPGAAARLRAALARGAHDESARAAVAAALHGPDDDDLKVVCAGLDLGAQRDLARGRFLAAEARLRLAGPLCGSSQGLLARAAALQRARGDAAYGSADLATAAGWYRAARALVDTRLDRARLADTLAGMAMLRLSAGALAEGRELAQEARQIDADRPRVIAAIDALPAADPRARMALLLVCLVLAVWVVRRLKRVMSRDE